MKVHRKTACRSLLINFVIGSALGLFAGFSQVQADESSTVVGKLNERLRKEVHAAGFKPHELGLWVGAKSPRGLETYFSQNAEKLFIPASLSKVVTAGAIFHQLHPGYKFKTLAVSDAKVENSILKGPIYLKGMGDPAFVSENMWFLVNEVTRSGINVIEGDVVVDDSRFDTVRFGDDRQEERVDRAYDAPVGAMSMNWNSVSVFVRPGEKVGDKLKVFADVASPYLQVRNETKTVAAGRGRTVTVERTSEKGIDGDVIIVRGAMAMGHPEAVYYKSISKPDLWSGHNFIEFLKQRGITVKGKVRLGSAPKEAKVIATSESRPLGNVVSEMMKWSNNYVAEMLVKNIAAEKGEQPATMAAGLKYVIQYLDAAGLKAGEYEFQNAAGLTRKNRFTPQQLGRVLEHAHSDFTIFPEYLTSFPVAGVDGTLRSRMKNSKAERWVRAKTGLLNGVVGLSGYAGRPAGEIASFVFIYNGPGREDRARALFDRMAAVLVED